MESKKILAFIPARGGSKGIPRKNIVDVGGRPLIARAIEGARSARYIDRVVVSSEDTEILRVAKHHGAEPIERPQELATDTAAPEPSLRYTLNHLRKSGYVPETVVYLQPTSPFRTAKDINEALEKFYKSKGSAALISVYSLSKSYLKSFTLNKRGFLAGTVNNRYPFMNRQQLPDIYMPNGAIYIIRTKEFLRTGKLFSKNTIPFVMEGDKNIDLDTLDDLKLVRQIFKKKKIR